MPKWMCRGLEVAKQAAGLFPHVQPIQIVKLKTLFSPETGQLPGRYSP